MKLSSILSTVAWVAALCGCIALEPCCALADDGTLHKLVPDFAFDGDQLVETTSPAELEALPPPITLEQDAAEQGTWSCPNWPDGSRIQSTVQHIPEYLPEGLVPPITGSTSEENRHYGVGQPLQGHSWLTHADSAGTFAGGIGGATLIDNTLEQGSGAAFGLRFGFDYDHRWGLEKRFGFAQMNVFDNLQHQHQIVNLELGDVDLLFYPWGDSRWRPYLSAGAGLAHFNYQSEAGRRIDRLLIGIPFGMGVKYFWNDGVAVRAEIVDNMMLGTHEVSTMNNVSMALGVEFRYSGFLFRKHS